MKSTLKKEIHWLLKEKYHFLPDSNFAKDVKRIEEGEPIDYIIGFKEFLGLTIDLSERPLIPREETEFWVKEVIKDIKPSSKILDMFSGSGCIGIAVLAHVQNSKVTFAEKDKTLVLQIKKNIKLNNLKNTKVIQSDVFKKVIGKYDYIFANPPYIPEKNKKKVGESVLKYEPKKALFSGKDGLQYIDKFLREAKNFLKEKGSIFMEFDPPEKKSIDGLLKKYGYQSWQFKKDQYNRWRHVCISI